MKNDEKKYIKNSIKNSLLMLITLMSSLASILSVIGIQIPLKLGIVILALILGIVCFTILFIGVYNLNKENVRLKKELQNSINMEKYNEKNDLKVIESIEHISYDTLVNSINEDINDIMIIASGTETYYTILVYLLKKFDLKSLSITILFRKGNDKKREGKLLQYNDKWNDLKKQYGLDLKFCYVQDFECSLRGILFNKKIGYIGFYHRIAGKTKGVEEKVLYIDKRQEIGSYVIYNFIRCFQEKEYFSSIEEVLNVSSMENQSL